MSKLTPAQEIIAALKRAIRICRMMIEPARTVWNYQRDVVVNETNDDAVFG